LYENLLAKIAKYKTARLLRRTVTSFATVKVEDLKLTIIELQPCVIAAMRISIRENRLIRPNGLRCSRVRTVPPLVGFLRADILK